MQQSSQKQRILSHLKSGGKITSFDSYLFFGITQLATRISELEDSLGVEFNRKWIKKNGKRFIEYSYKID
jgi:hypothetical protein